MNKRGQPRIKTHHIAKICGKTGLVNNVSGTGMLISTPILPEKRWVDVSMEIYGKEIVVSGTIQWFIRKNSIRALNQLGLDIKDAPLEFYTYVNSLECND